MKWDKRGIGRSGGGKIEKHKNRGTEKGGKVDRKGQKGFIPNVTPEEK